MFTRRLLPAIAALLLLGLASQCAPLSQPDVPTGLSDGAALMLPVDAQDPTWGAQAAPVTVVTFVDYQCPFCAQMHATLEKLKSELGPEQLRVVVKHFPLEFHDRANAAAVAAQAVYRLGQALAFEKYEALLFAHQTELTQENLERWAAQVGVSAPAFRRAMDDADVARVVSRSLELGYDMGVEGTPHVFVNGYSLPGAQSYPALERVVRYELAAGEKLAASGVAPAQIYPARVTQNLQAAQGETVRPVAVPVGSSPALGAARPLVTIVEFSDFECPFCSRVRPTLARLLEAYPQDLQVVFKHNPLAFHRLALPAARIASLVRLRRGEAAFWKILTVLFEQGGQLSPETLNGISRDAGLAAADIESALAGTVPEVEAWLAADADLAFALGVQGTPNFFVNGRRLQGAVPFPEFDRFVQLGLAEAHGLLESGVPREQVPAELLRRADPAPEPERLDLGAVPAQAASWGPAGAPVVVQMFADFECAFCGQALATLRLLKEEHPEQVRVVWRHLPLPFHRNAEVAAQVSEEVRRQRGDGAFWQMATQIFATPPEQRGLDLEQLVAMAEKLGATPEEVRRAVTERRYADVIASDLAAAQGASLSGTPAFSINGYRLVGAQPLGVFRWLVRRALSDVKAAPSPPAPTAPSGELGK